MLFRRFKSDPNIPGTEKLVVARLNDAIGPRPCSIPTAEVAPATPDLLGPMSVFLVKGWSRSVCAVGVLLHAYEDPQVLEARSLTSI